jgi:hypothetical protein
MHHPVSRIRSLERKNRILNSEERISFADWRKKDGRAPPPKRYVLCALEVESQPD